MRSSTVSSNSYEATNQKTPVKPNLSVLCNGSFHFYTFMLLTLLPSPLSLVLVYCDGFQSCTCLCAV